MPTRIVGRRARPCRRTPGPPGDIVPRERASRFDDRRLDAAEELRGALPVMLLRPQAALIVNAAANDDFAAADLHIAVLDRFAEQVRTHPGAPDAAIAAEQRLRDLRAAIDQAEDELLWPSDRWRHIRS